MSPTPRICGLLSEDDVRRLCAAGKTMRQIAELAVVSESTVRNFRRRLGITGKHGGARVNAGRRPPRRCKAVAW